MKILDSLQDIQFLFLLSRRSEIRIEFSKLIIESTCQQKAQKKI